MYVIKVTCDYSSFLYEEALETMQEDREALSAYGAIRCEESPSVGSRAWTVEYETEDGWDARGQFEETLIQLHGEPAWEKVSR